MNVEYWAIPDHIRQKILKEIMRLEDTVTEQVFILHFLTKVRKFSGDAKFQICRKVRPATAHRPKGPYDVGESLKMP